MSSLLIRNARVVNEGRQFDADIRVINGRIDTIAPEISNASADVEIDAAGDWLLPGMIDDQVHFRDPGSPAKGSFHSESRAAVAGGITSYMDMPNTRPATLTLDALADKKRRAATASVANYAFHFGVSNDNLDTVATLDPRQVAGVKVFMGASTGNMLVDDPHILERLFAEVPTILLAHCEHTPTIDTRLKNLKDLLGGAVPPTAHPLIRNAEACYRSSSLAVELAKKHGTRLHVLHLTTERELELFENKPLGEKHISAEVCLHHLLFDENDYPRLGNQIKCNPAIKQRSDRDALRQALLSDRLDVIGSDHAPHTWEEKQRPYEEAPSGLPLVQHALPALMELVADHVLPLTTLVAKTSHRVADLFAIAERGYLREGYWADLVLLNRQPLRRPVNSERILYECGWTPFAERSFRHHVGTTVVSGQVAWHAGQIQDGCQGLPLQFLR
ncbi:dihydroorotase [Pseudomonas asplenii]|uniref:Dihydroorotase n=1 Tax=Pseudomonas asplenii TaxID=53407 RepID=A0A1H6LTR5_9PSED|nr:dihydroorotase [Pseudomonas fuscovaginae]SEH88214.1 dihydroorotase [Pseudomonas fuscovaginae]